MARTRTRWAAGWMLTLCALSGPLAADPPASSLGEGPQGLNLLVGSWRVEAQIRNSPISTLAGEGTMEVAWSEAGDVLEADMRIAFERFAVNGVTRRSWDAASQRWKVSWHPTEAGQSEVLDIDGAYLAGRFLEIDTGRDDYGAYIGRLVIEARSADHLVVRKDRLYDDGTLLPETWSYQAFRVEDSAPQE